MSLEVVEEDFAFEDPLHYYIADYLRQSQMHRSKEVFLTECRELLIRGAERRRADSLEPETIDELTGLFDDGSDEDRFFRIWEDEVPHLRLMKSYKRINFRLKIYFFCREILDFSAQNEKGLRAIQTKIRNFFDAEGSDLSSEPELTPFFALPFVQDPQNHPTFRDLFEENNWVQLRSDLLQYFSELTSSLEFNSQFAKILSVKGKRSEFEILKLNYSKLFEKHQDLKKAYQKLIGVTRELSWGLEEASKNRGSVDWKLVLGKCSRIFPELFPTQLAVLQSESIAIEAQRDRARRISKNLRYDRIKSDFFSGKIPRKNAFILQALRWLLSKNRNEDRQFTIQRFHEEDIFGFSKDSELGRHLLKYLRNAEYINSLIQQSLIRLLNTIASLRLGRIYLENYEPFVEAAIDSLSVHTASGDFTNLMVEMLVATLQKLSLKCTIRKLMISRGIIEWLVRYLDQSSFKMNSYGMEYATALFMNLCLHKSGKEKCLPLAKTVLSIMSNILTTTSDTSKQTLSYVNGTLFSLLTYKEIVAEARHLGLDFTIRKRFKTISDLETKKRMDYVAGLIENPLSNEREDLMRIESDNEDGEDNDDDAEIEDEVDADDPLALVCGEDLHGLDLLESEYVDEKVESKAQVLPIESSTSHDETPVCGLTERPPGLESPLIQQAMSFPETIIKVDDDTEELPTEIKHIEDSHKEPSLLTEMKALKLEDYSSDKELDNNIILEEAVQEVSESISTFEDSRENIETVEENESYDENADVVVIQERLSPEFEKAYKENERVLLQPETELTEEETPLKERGEKPVETSYKSVDNKIQKKSRNKIIKDVVPEKKRDAASFQSKASASKRPLNDHSKKREKSLRRIPQSKIEESDTDEGVVLIMENETSSLSSSSSNDLSHHKFKRKNTTDKNRKKGNEIDKKRANTRELVELKPINRRSSVNQQRRRNSCILDNFGTPEEIFPPSNSDIVLPPLVGKTGSESPNMNVQSSPLKRPLVYCFTPLRDIGESFTLPRKRSKQCPAANAKFFKVCGFSKHEEKCEEKDEIIALFSSGPKILPSSDHSNPTL